MYEILFENDYDHFQNSMIILLVLNSFKNKIINFVKNSLPPKLINT